MVLTVYRCPLMVVIDGVYVGSCRHRLALAWQRALCRVFILEDLNTILSSLTDHTQN